MKCYYCNKKITPSSSLLCKCNNVFCMEHRYTFIHNCNAYQKNEQIKILESNMPKIVSDKIDKI